MGEDIYNFRTLNVCISKIYRESLHIIKKHRKNSTERPFKNSWIGNLLKKNFKRPMIWHVLYLSVKREMQTKTTLDYTIHSSIGKNPSMTIPYVRKCAIIRALIYCWWDCKLVNLKEKLKIWQLKTWCIKIHSSPSPKTQIMFRVADCNGQKL